ncbi:MAG: Na/Pi cotransporter family protein, partial [Firmicutes bacterium]|nr:Na/Pi cotransporter family protein [Candidatus Colimorpha enterica]
VMGSSLEKLAGSRLKSILGKMTSNVFKGFGFGVVITAAIQSSAATIVMVVGFVNSGLMNLAQASGVIMGANIGTSVTGWIISFSGIKGSDSIYYLLLFVGVFLFWFIKKQKVKNIGLIIIGFSVLMVGMQIMSGAVSGLKNSDMLGKFVNVLSNPILGLLFGIVFTIIIQSSSASVGVLQSFAAGYAMPFSFCVPFILGANIGTCSTVIISAIGASRESKRTAAVDLIYNVVSTLIILPIYVVINKIFAPALLSEAASTVGIAIANTSIKVIQLVIMFPLIALMCKLATLIIPDVKDTDDKTSLLDERLLAAPEVAIERAHEVTTAMGDLSVKSLKEAVETLDKYDSEVIERIDKAENLVDTYEDKLGSFLVKLSEQNLTQADNREVCMLLQLIGDYERISDHAKNIAESSTELHDKKIEFTPMAKKELATIIGAVTEILDMSFDSYTKNDASLALNVEPLEEVVDDLKDTIKANHITRLSRGECTIELGFILSDLLTDLERVSDHCSNVALSVVINNEHYDLSKHEYSKGVKSGGAFFDEKYEMYKSKYAVEATV